MNQATNCDPVGDWTDPVPQVETRVEKLARWIVEGRSQRILAAREFAKRQFQDFYDKPPSNEQWSKAWRIAGGGQ